MSNAIVRVIEGFLEPARVNGRDKKVMQQLMEQVTAIQGVADVAKIVVDEISNTTGYADFKMTTTLEGSRKIAEAVTDGEAPPEMKEAHARLRNMYIESMLDVVHITNTKLVHKAFVDDNRR